MSKTFPVYGTIDDKALKRAAFRIRQQLDNISSHRKVSFTLNNQNQDYYFSINTNEYIDFLLISYNTNGTFSINIYEDGTIIYGMSSSNFIMKNAHIAINHIPDDITLSHQYRFNLTNNIGQNGFVTITVYIGKL